MSNEKIRIAYVEDEPSIAELLSSGLGLIGVNVNPVYMKAEMLLENLETPEIEEAQMFVFDIRLPGMTGVELARKLREIGEKRPFLLVSAWPPPTQEELDEMGARFLPKPFDFMEVIATVKDILGV